MTWQKLYMNNYIEIEFVSSKKIAQYAKSYLSYTENIMT